MKEMIVSKVKIQTERSDGSNMSIEITLPYDIEAQVLYDLLDWENRFVATTSTVKKFERAKLKFDTKKP